MSVITLELDKTHTRCNDPHWSYDSD